MAMLQKKTGGKSESHGRSIPPRLFFLSHCQNVTLCGVTFKNSPSWTLHPYFSDNLKFYGLTINNPSDSAQIRMAWILNHAKM